jgi:hypothetical protein
MNLPASSRLQFTSELNICRVLNGMWQVSGAHGRIDPISLIDCRPLVNMVQYCLENDIKLLAYGTVCGGLLSEKFLGQPEPRGGMLSTASLRKYKNMVDSWGGWSLFQELLNAIRGASPSGHRADCPEARS